MKLSRSIVLWVVGLAMIPLAFILLGLMQGGLGVALMMSCLVASVALIFLADRKKYTDKATKAINWPKRKRDGGLRLLVGLVMAIAAVILYVSVHWIFAYLAAMFALLYLAQGIGILWKGIAGDPPGRSTHRYCPHCHQELMDENLPDPGLTASCPKCGGMYGREDW